MIDTPVQSRLGASTLRVRTVEAPGQARGSGEKHVKRGHRSDGHFTPIASLGARILTCFALSSSAFAAQAQSDPWEMFESRCLVPMTKSEEVDVAGLIGGDGPPQVQEYEDPTTGLRLHFGKLSGNAYCGMSSDFVETPKMEGGWTRWRAEALASGEYRVDGPSAVVTSDGRQPPLIVRFTKGGHPSGSLMLVGELHVEN